MTGPLAGEPRERRRDLPAARRVRSWLVWWVLMMSFWVMLDDSVSTDELLAGAGAAALAALLAEVVTYQAATRFRMRIEWLVPALQPAGRGGPRHGDRVPRPVASPGARRAAAQRLSRAARPVRR